MYSTFDAGVIKSVVLSEHGESNARVFQLACNIFRRYKARFGAAECLAAAVRAAAFALCCTLV